MHVNKFNPKTLAEGTVHVLFHFRGVNTNYRFSCPLRDRQMASFCPAAVTRAYYNTSRCVSGMQTMQVSKLCQAGQVLSKMFRILYQNLTEIIRGTTTFQMDHF